MALPYIKTLLKSNAHLEVVSVGFVADKVEMGLYFF